jgi:hypothetical protein
LAAQITQLHKFQYMGNHGENLVWPQTYTSPSSTLSQNNNKDTWQHLLSLCNNQFLKSLIIATQRESGQSEDLPILFHIVLFHLIIEPTFFLIS